MRAAVVSIEIHATAEAIFDLVHDYDRRLQWDPFLREARLLHGADSAGRGVTSRCVARLAAGGAAMDTVYVSFDRPRVAAVKMTRGPVYLRSFAASMRQDDMENSRTRVIYAYSFHGAPRWGSWVIEPVIDVILRSETRRRLTALKQFVEGTDPTHRSPNPCPTPRPRPQRRLWPHSVSD